VNRLLQTLDDAVMQRRAPRALLFLRAERAVVLVRLGETDRARAEIARLRAGDAVRDHPSLEPWLCLAEGLADCDAGLTSQARDRMRRALVLARSTRSTRALPLAAAWMAHLDFQARDDASAVEHLVLALETAPADHHSARARLCLVMACMRHCAGSEEQAQPWYSQARIHAQAEGDGAALSAVMCSLALLRVVEVRLSAAFGAGPDAAALRRAVLGAEASVSLVHRVSTLALRHHLPMQQAQLLVLSGRPAEALALYESHRIQAAAAGLASSECVFLADQAWCLVELGRGDEALVRARAADSALITAAAPQDRAIAHALLARVHGRLGLAEVAALHTRQAAQCHQTYRQRTDALRALIERPAFRTPPC
jgi:tetratricopeptide (TPR) repeat protein